MPVSNHLNLEIRINIMKGEVRPPMNCIPISAINCPTTRWSRLVGILLVIEGFQHLKGWF